MARPRSKIKEVCQNNNCNYFLKEKGKDVIKRVLIVLVTGNIFAFIAEDTLLKLKALLCTTVN
jgi:hypothetical protein